MSKGKIEKFSGAKVLISGVCGGCRGKMNPEDVVRVFHGDAGDRGGIFSTG